jgi:hypothetical protein
VLYTQKTACVEFGRRSKGKTKQETLKFTVKELPCKQEPLLGLISEAVFGIFFHSPGWKAKYAGIK